MRREVLIFSCFSTMYAQADNATDPSKEDATKEVMPSSSITKADESLKELSVRDQSSQVRKTTTQVI